MGGIVLIILIALGLYFGAWPVVGAALVLVVGVNAFTFWSMWDD